MLYDNVINGFMISVLCYTWYDFYVMLGFNLLFYWVLILLYMKWCMVFVVWFWIVMIFRWERKEDKRTYLSGTEEV